jgi:allantoinase
MMSSLDVIIRGGQVVTPAEVRKADIGILNGRIVELGPTIPYSARETIDASGLHVFPGLIDSHVHFNEPGRAEWEGVETGSKALAAGGGTMFFDMPLNAHPPTLDAESFDQKRRAVEAKSFADFAFWGGLVPQNLDRLEELSERGVIGFKAFMSNSGIEDFPHADGRTLREGMKHAAALGKIVAVHAESESITSQLAEQSISAGKMSVRDYLASRPIHAELEAIQRALELAAETQCRLHIVHVSCGAGIALIASARKMGVDVSCETCPHYLVLTEEDMEQIGPLAKCAPPLRPKQVQDALWQYLVTDQITTVGSDHSPAPTEMKKNQNFFRVWGGISGIQHTLPLLITEGRVRKGMALASVARLLSFNVVTRFRLPTEKGRVAVGTDADLALVDLNASFEVEADTLFYRHRHTPYAGRRLTGKVVQTILRGQTIYNNGQIMSKPMGRFVRPIFSY